MRPFSAAVRISDLNSICSISEDDEDKDFKLPPDQANAKLVGVFERFDGRSAKCTHEFGMLMGYRRARKFGVFLKFRDRSGKRCGDEQSRVDLKLLRYAQDYNGQVFRLLDNYLVNCFSIPVSRGTDNGGP